MASLSPACSAPLVAIVGLSARMLAQSANRARLRVAALDIFGDRDTRAASALWFDVADAGLALDRARVVDALRRIARLPRVVGWVAGSGTEPLVDELSETRGLPPLIGNSAQACSAVREPRRFFALLNELGVAHPDVSFVRPSNSEGWIFKRADGCGGMHIVAADAVGAGDIARGYFQREAVGRSCSALFVASPRSVAIVGFAEQTSTAIGAYRFVHTGAIGPIALPDSVAARLHEAICAISRNAGLAGINSCDFLLDSDAFSLLEINARPSATMALYEAAQPQRWPLGLLACHIDACTRGGKPCTPSTPNTPSTTAGCAGQQVVFAPHAFVCSGAFSDACHADPGCRDVPMPGVHIAAGEPLCTVVATAQTPDAVRRALDRQRERLVERIETLYRDLDYVSTAYHA